MLLRILNTIILIPVLFLIMIVYTIYPIIGYIIGRGFQNSLDSMGEVYYHTFTKSPYSGFKALCQVILTGKVKDS